jgi:hypothetical protein
MKKILLSIAAVAALGAAVAPAAAQPWNGHDDARYHTPAPPQRLTLSYVDSLDARITNAARAGRISSTEARDLHHDQREIRPIAWRVQTGHATHAQAMQVDRVVTHIEQSLDAARYADNHHDHDWRR